MEKFVGGSADDRLVNTSQVANTFSGGGGRDTVDYSVTTEDLTVSLDGQPGDGAAGEGDQVLADVEDVLAGSGDDTLRGSASGNRLEAGSGDDRLWGGTGADDLIGGPGFDFAEFTDRSTSLVLSADGSPTSGDASDGLVGARDRIGTDVEGLVGGSGADRLTGNAADNDLDGGLGADILNGAGGSDTANYLDRTKDLFIVLDGEGNDGEAGEGDNVGPNGDVERVISGEGDDVLVGDDARNLLDAAAGDDLLDGGGGPDTLIGDGGDDIVSYLFRSEGVTATIDGTAGSGSALDGPPGARDTIGHDVEHLWGGEGSDHLTGDAASNLLYGNRGADVLSGGPGDDAADYSDRSTSVSVSPNDASSSGNSDDGPPGARDTIRGDVEAIFAGSGDDSLVGSSAANYLDAGAGNDTINSRDAGEDLDFCGDGSDTVFVDENDLIDVSCEADYLPGEEPQPPGSLVVTIPPAMPTPDRNAPLARLTVTKAQRLGRVLSRGLALNVSCNEACRLTGRLQLDGKAAKRLGLNKRVKAVTIATGAAPKAGKLVLRFSSSAKRKLRRTKRLALTLVVTAVDSSGNRSTIKRRIVMTRKGATASRREFVAVVARRSCVDAVFGPIRGSDEPAHSRVVAPSAGGRVAPPRGKR